MSISVVIPTYNEADFLEKCLTALSQQTHKPIEIIVADYNSTDDTQKIAKKFGAKIIRVSQKGVGAAREAGTKAAKGEIIASTDADTVVPKNWLERINSEFEKDKTLVGFGGLFELYSGPITAKLGTKYLAFPVFLMDRIFSKGWTMSGNNMSFTKSAFEKIGGYNTTLHVSEDSDLALRLHSIGKVKLDRHFVVYSSGRRYFKRGFIRGQLDLAPNVLTRMFFKKFKFNVLPAFRKDH